MSRKQGSKNKLDVVDGNEMEKIIDSVKDSSPTSAPQIRAKRLKVDIPLNTLVEVTNGFNGRLVYVSKRNPGYTVIFDNFGDSFPFELQELISARNSDINFFKNNWWLINDIEILEYLTVEKYYINAFNTENFDKIFDKSPAEIEETVGKMSQGQRNTLIYRAKEFIETGKLDSRKTISALEKALNVELIER